jgi:hypothetical protein
LKKLSNTSVLTLAKSGTTAEELQSNYVLR